MKTKLYSIITVVIAVCVINASQAQSNKSLSNLTAPTAINQSLLPNTNNSKDLGSSTLGWRNVYVGNQLFLNKRLTMFALGSGNFFAGADAGNVSVAGGNNTGIGQYSLGNITSGLNNTAIGYTALFNNTSGRDNVASGYLSLYANSTGSYNAAAGTWTLYNNTTGNNNTALGYSALWQNKTGSNNTAIGKYAMYSNSTGYSNVAIGTSALYNSTKTNNLVAIGDSALYNYIGDFFNSGYNTAVGSKALYSATSANENTAIGRDAMYNTTRGSYNVSIGVSALYDNTEGLSNTAVGRRALVSNTIGSQNTAIGNNSLSADQNGVGNTAVGSYAGTNNTNFTNSTALGYFTLTTASNQVRVGNTAVTSIGGQVGWTIFSDGRYKRNMKENVAGLAFINSLRPITYTVDIKSLNEYLNKGRKQLAENGKELTDEKAKAISDKASDEAGKIIHDGFVAQEVEEAAKKLGFTFSGVDKPKSDDGLYGLRYDNFVVPLVKAVQELSKQNDSLLSKIKQLENGKSISPNQQKINELQERIEKLESLIVNQSAVNGKQVAAISSASLEQNTPNPFTNSTTIHYVLPQKFSFAQIVITDMNGRTIKAVNASGQGKGTLSVDAATLSTGAYNYSLIVDGKRIDTKQMVLIK